MDTLSKGWFSELNPFFPAQAFSLEVEKVLHHEKSKFQDILVFKSKTYGRVLVLDGLLQCAEKDEFAYHEIFTHVPLFSHPNPRTVLVVGGGDGGIVREVGKHPMVEEIHICELDEKVIEVCKQYLPQTAVGFSNPNLHIHIQDGVEFVKQHPNTFDVIITDSSDPIGPADCLFNRPYFEAVSAALKPGGIHASQEDSVWRQDSEETERIGKDYCAVFPVVSYVVASVPSFPDGSIGFFLVSKSKETVFEEPLRKLSESEVEEMGLKYYNSDVHKAAFVLPQFAKKVIKLINSGTQF